jgi:formate dehydrogenase subunit delta
MPGDGGDDKLIRMANQIATFFMSQPEQLRVEGVATHINKFWEPRMRQQLYTRVDHGGDDLMPLVMAALPLIKRPSDKPEAPLVPVPPAKAEM